MDIQDLVEYKSHVQGFEYWFEEHNPHVTTQSYFTIKEPRPEDRHPRQHSYWIVCPCGSQLFTWDVEQLPIRNDQIPVPAVMVAEKIPTRRKDPDWLL